MSRISKDHIDAIESFNTYFLDKVYEFKFNDNLIKLEVNEDDFDCFIGYRKFKNSKKRSVSFCGLVRVLNDDNVAVKISSDKVAILNLDQEKALMIAIFELINNELKFTDIDYNVANGGKSLDENEYINILKRIKYAKHIKLENAFIKEQKKKIRSI